jgi:hypothetical protein
LPPALQITVRDIQDRESGIGRTCHVKLREPVRMWERQRPQQHSADHAEDGRVGADRQRECRDRSTCKGRSLAPGPHGKADVPKDGLDRLHHAIRRRTESHC